MKYSDKTDEIIKISEIFVKIIHNISKSFKNAVLSRYGTSQRLYFHIYMWNFYIDFAKNRSKYSKNTQNNDRTAKKRETS